LERSKKKKKALNEDAEGHPLHQQLTPKAPEKVSYFEEL
jgi:hypothetical protein